MPFRRIMAAAFCTACLFAIASSSVAGTTGGIHGRVIEATGTSAPIADAAVSAVSPSQAATTKTDATGHFDFLSLAPDTYTVTVSKSGYTTEGVPGVTVISDQTRTLTIALKRALKTLTTVTVRGAESLVRPGTTSNVFSVGAATQKATASLAGAGGLNQAYGSVAAAPGVVYQQGQAGWYQSVYIRGGDIDQVAYELDGIPVQRVSDSAPVSVLSILGQAELQVYTGGTPASAEASGIAGYVNQVIRTGTYPGFANLSLAVGSPTLYNSVIGEFGGASPDRRFSYYVGIANATQGYRYSDQNNGAGNPLFFFPQVIPNNNINTNTVGKVGVYDGCGVHLPAPDCINYPTYTGGPTFAPGIIYAIGQTTNQEAIGNFHYGIPHHFDTGKDDIQFLYVYSNILHNFYSSIDDLGLNNPVALNAVNTVTSSTGPLSYLDIPVYTGQVMGYPYPNQVVTQYFPGTNTNRLPNSAIPPDLREGSQNGMALEKLQWQRNINDKTYFRIYASSNYNWWFITGPVSALLPFGDQLPDYEVIGHNWSATGVYSQQLNEKNLLNATVSYFTGKLQTYSMGFFNSYMTNLVDANNNCYDGATGNYSTCFDTTAGATDRGCAPSVANFCTTSLIPANPPPGTPATLNGAQWTVTEPGFNAQVDNVRPDFWAGSVTDQWRPSDKTTVNLGLRVEDYTYTLQNLAQGYPARAFWFAAYNRENCFGNGIGIVTVPINPATGAPGACPAGTAPVNLQNYTGGKVTDVVWEPRVAFTQQISADTVIRGSYGRYSRPAPTSYLEFNTIQQDLPSFIGSFLAFGYNSPFHPTHADISNNYDISWEQHIHGTDTQFKVTPFLRNTQGQIQYLSLNAQGVVDGLNVGQQTSEGVEFSVTKGSFARDGLSALLTATYTNSRIKYSNFPNGLNLVDLLNQFVQRYNGYTAACAGSVGTLCTATGVASTNAFQCFAAGVGYNNGALPCNLGDITNPYYTLAPQPLFDRNGSYTTYDQIPAPFNNAIGFATPFQTSLVINYRKGPFYITPSLQYSTQGKYGSPLVWPGYAPNTCTAAVAGSNNADTTTCSDYLMIPDKYTGKFDNLGAFNQPQRLSLNVALGYDINKHISAQITVANLVDQCFQHHMPWDNASTCMYAQLASNLLAPAGNFVANPPVQLAYPYGNWYNNIEIGQEGQKAPLQAVFQLNFHL